MIRVRTASRLHLGLIDPAGAWGREFGGAGVMVEEPGLEMAAAPAQGFTAAGPLASRVLSFAAAIAATGRAPGRSPRGAHIEVLRAPPDHVGLGTGTQLGLAVGAALAALDGERPSAAELARRAGRGMRSAIGVHGFERGGLLVDGGKKRPEEIAPLIARLTVPESWRFVLAIPGSSKGLSGDREKEAFRHLAGDSRSRSETLCRILLLAVLPALAAGDLAAFGEALSEYGRRAGEFFRETQGGVYASPLVEEIVSCLLAEGAAGAGQSSWGPTAFGLARDEGQAARLRSALRSRFGLCAGEVILAGASNRGAEVERRDEEKGGDPRPILLR